MTGQPGTLLRDILPIPMLAPEERMRDAVAIR